MRTACLLLTLLTGLTATAPRAAAATDETADSAIWLLEKATLVHQDGRHNILLRALRQMKDPALEPLFSALVQKSHPVLKIHGILGLAEISDQQKLDLALVTDLKDPAVQARLLSSAIESDLLSKKQARQLLDWPGLDQPVKLIVAAYLADKTDLDRTRLLDDALQSDKPAARGLAALLKLHRGDRSAMEQLNALNDSDKAEREGVRRMLLKTAMRYDYASIAPWAVEVAREPDIDRSLAVLALRTALEHQAPGAVEAWMQRYESTSNQADRIRLGVLALDLAGDVQDPAMFEPLLQEDSQVLNRIGRAGQKIARGRTARSEVLKLLELNHLLAARWVLQHARDLPIERAKPLLVGIILNAQGEPNPDRFRGQRLEATVLAAQQIAEKADDAGPVLRKLIHQTPALTQEAVIMGLIRCEADEPHRYIEGLRDWPSDTARSLALLLRAKHGADLSEKETDQLGLIVRGGAGLQEPLRAQAAWQYLKLTDQAKFALAEVLDR